MAEPERFRKAAAGPQKPGMTLDGGEAELVLSMFTGMVNSGGFYDPRETRRRLPEVQRLVERIRENIPSLA
jgi:hypothetical protein